MNPLLLVGAGGLARETLAAARLSRDVLGFVDDNPRLRRRRVHGVQVVGAMHELPRLLERTNPDVVLITIPNAPLSCAAAFSAVNACVAGFIRQPGVPLRTARSTRARSERVCRAPLVTAIQTPPGASTRRSSRTAVSRPGT